MVEATADPKALTSNALAATRTALAADRTLMAWVRTALGMISFGFSIHKFMHALGAREASPRVLGIILAAIGTAALGAGTIQYTSVLRALGGRRAGFTYYVAIAVIVLGVLVLAGIALRLGPLA